jgi:hypothetical protein
MEPSVPKSKKEEGKRCSNKNLFDFFDLAVCFFFKPMEILSFLKVKKVNAGALPFPEIPLPHSPWIWYNLINYRNSHFRSRVMKKAILGLVIGLCVATVYGQVPRPGGLGGGGMGPGIGDPNNRARIKSDMAMMVMDDIIPMRFIDAVSGDGIPSAQIVIANAGTFTTDNRGIIQVPLLADGSYTMTFSKTGYITTPIDFPVQLGQVIFNWFSVSPGMTGDYRFTLDWGERPVDLDLHFQKQGSYHISYNNMRESADGSVKLDRDDRNGYGPETITVARSEAGSAYELYVIDYTNRSSSSSDALSRSGAAIRVYNSSQLLHTFRIPPGAGTRWNVCRIERNQIVPVNTVVR